MIELSGYWYQEHSSARMDAVLKFERQTYLLQIDDQDIQGQVAHISVSQRVGNIPRRITFANGSVFVCEDNEAIDRWLRQTGHIDGRFHLLHRLESQWRWVILSVVVVLTLSVGFIWKGIPWISTEIAHSIPVEVYQKLGSGTLDGLDKWLLGDSELSEAIQESINQRFERILAGIEQDEYQFRLHFRTMQNPRTKQDLANAFALPSGDIVVTDALVHLAEHDEEIDSVLMHEMAHVVQRHSLQQIIHSSALTVIVTLLLGDATALPNIAIALPTFLLENHYSRRHETEADEYALAQMVRAGIDPVHFADMMRKFMALELEAGGATEKSTADADEINSYLSSHPATQQRIDRALEYAQRSMGH